jgi:hypothetical protein
LRKLKAYLKTGAKTELTTTDASAAVNESRLQKENERFVLSASSSRISLPD